MSTPSEHSDEPKPSTDGLQQPALPEPAADVLNGDQAPAQEAADSPSDRRIHPRRRKLLRVQVMDVVSTAQPFSGWVVDRSLGGMCITVDHEIEEGTVLKVRANAPASASWVEVRVQSVRSKDGGFDLGCEFLRTPTWETLLQFG